METVLVNKQEEEKINEKYVNDKKKFFFVVRFLLLLVLLVFLFINTTNGFALVKNEVICVEDHILDFTGKINNYLLNHEKLRIFLVILTSLGLDILMISFMIIWTIKGKSWQPIISYFTYFLLFILAQSIFQRRSPTNYLMNFPGFPSIFVHYNNNPFFAYFVGLPVIAGIELNHLKLKKLSILCFSFCLVESMLMIILRGYYIIDIIAGIIFAHYCSLITEKLFSRFEFYKI